ncbi:MAG: AAA family ATPase [Alphaproteobacteria bacterium]|nr:AAA family ATPase [Alphaproteobacteria bacterium]
MILTLTVSNFRNHESSRIKTCGAKTVIITGPNGSGKTSILEAISTLSAGGGLRGAGSDEMRRISSEQGIGFGVVAELEDETKLSVSWTEGDTYRRATVDGDAAPLSDLARYLRLVWLTPKEDRLFYDSASDRRAFFDRLAASFDSAHAGRVARMAKLLSERAFALKSGAASEWLRAIEKQLAETAVAVAAARVKYVGEVNYFLGHKAYGTGNNEDENALCPMTYALAIAGVLEQKLSAGQNAMDTEKEYAEYLSDERALVHEKMTIDGAHKSDMTMFNQPLSMNVAMTSTGQQKSALLSLIIAHAKLLHAKTNARPVVLLDEAAAHLDADARANLFAELSETDSQVWATGVCPLLFQGVGGAIFIGCENGRIIEQ